MSWAALLLAAAMLIGADARPRVRAALTAVQPLRVSPPGVNDPFGGGVQLGRACGLRMLNRAADLLALGAEPATAWTNITVCRGSPWCRCRCGASMPRGRPPALRPALTAAPPAWWRSR